jgi:hypothetical protein
MATAIPRVMARPARGSRVHPFQKERRQRPGRGHPPSWPPWTPSRRRRPPFPPPRLLCRLGPVPGPAGPGTSPPQTTLSRFSAWPLEARATRCCVATLSCSPEDTGLGREAPDAPPDPPPATSKEFLPPHRLGRRRAREEEAGPQGSGQGLGWRPNERGLGGGGWRAPGPRIFWGRFFEAKDQHLVQGATSGPAPWVAIPLRGSRLAALPLTHPPRVRDP